MQQYARFEIVGTVWQQFGVRRSERGNAYLAFLIEVKGRFPERLRVVFLGDLATQVAPDLIPGNVLKVKGKIISSKYQGHYECTLIGLAYEVIERCANVEDAEAAEFLAEIDDVEF